jgi:hypothetical protein
MPKTSKVKWKTYRQRKLETENHVFEDFKGPIKILETDNDGNCGCDSIAAALDLPRTKDTFDEMREYVREFPEHEIDHEYEMDENGNAWLEVEDIAIICTQKYNVFPIIYNGLWKPEKRVYKKERTAEQIRKQSHGTDQSNFFCCPFFISAKNYYQAPKNATTKYIIIKMIQNRHYQPLGVLMKDGLTVQTKFEKSDLPDFWQKRLEIDCFNPIKEFRLMNGFNDDDKVIHSPMEKKKSTLEKTKISEKKPSSKKNSKKEEEEDSKEVEPDNKKTSFIHQNKERLVDQAKFLRQLFDGELDVSHDILVNNVEWGKKVVFDLHGLARDLNEIAEHLDLSINKIP